MDKKDYTTVEAVARDASPEAALWLRKLSAEHEKFLAYAKHERDLGYENGYAQAQEYIDKLESALRRFKDFFVFVEAVNEMQDNDPLPDHAVLAHVMAGGGSDALHAADFRYAQTVLLIGQNREK